MVFLRRRSGATFEQRQSRQLVAFLEFCTCLLVRRSLGDKLFSSNVMQHYSINHCSVPPVGEGKCHLMRGCVYQWEGGGGGAHLNQTVKQITLEASVSGVLVLNL